MSPTWPGRHCRACGVQHNKPASLGPLLAGRAPQQKLGASGKSVCSDRGGVPRVQADPTGQRWVAAAPGSVLPRAHAAAGSRALAYEKRLGFPSRRASGPAGLGARQLYGPHTPPPAPTRAARGRAGLRCGHGLPAPAPPNRGPTVTEPSGSGAPPLPEPDAGGAPKACRRDEGGHKGRGLGRRPCSIPC